MRKSVKNRAQARPAPQRSERDIIVAYMHKYFKRLKMSATVLAADIPQGVGPEEFIRKESARKLAVTMEGDIKIKKQRGKYEISLDVYLPIL